MKKTLAMSFLSLVFSGISIGADLDISKFENRFGVDKFQKTNLMYAVWEGNVEEVKRIIEDAKRNLSPKEYLNYINHVETGKSVLSYAIYSREYGYTLNGIEAKPVSKQTRLELLDILMKSGVSLFSEQTSSLEHSFLIEHICKYSSESTVPSQRTLMKLAHESSPLNRRGVVEGMFRKSLEKKLAKLEKCEAEMDNSAETQVLKADHKKPTK